MGMGDRSTKDGPSLDFQGPLIILRLPKTHSSHLGPLGTPDPSLPIRTHRDPGGQPQPPLSGFPRPFRPLSGPRIHLSPLPPAFHSSHPFQDPSACPQNHLYTLQGRVLQHPPGSLGPQPLKLPSVPSLSVPKTASTSSRLPMVPPQALSASQTPWHPQFPHGPSVRSPWVSLRTSTLLNALSDPKGRMHIPRGPGAPARLQLPLNSPRSPQYSMTP